MGTLETFEHTADVGLRIWGTDLDDVFRTAAEGLMGYVVVNRGDVQAEGPELVAVQADSPEDLLVAWLNELVFRVETRHRLYARFDVHVSDEGRHLEGLIAGEPIDRARHVLDHEVKAVTHHGTRLVRDDGGWLAEV